MPDETTTTITPREGIDLEIDGGHEKGTREEGAETEIDQGEMTLETVTDEEGMIPLIQGKSDVGKTVEIVH